jgi:gas vesicle protein
MAGLYYGGFVGVFLGAIVGLTTALAGRDRGRQIAIAGGP